MHFYQIFYYQNKRLLLLKETLRTAKNSETLMHNVKKKTICLHFLFLNMHSLRITDYPDRCRQRGERHYDNNVRFLKTV